MRQRILKKVIIIVIFTSCYYALHGRDIIISNNGKIDWGSYPAEENRIHTFTLTNCSQKAIKIIKIRSTCNCLINDVSISEILPGKKMQIQVLVKSNTVSGDFVKSIYVETNMPQQRFIRLELRGKAIPLVQIKPAAQFYAGKLKAGQIYMFQFDLIPSRSSIELSVISNPDLQLTKTTIGWKVVCKLVPSTATPIIEKNYFIKIKNPTGQAPLHLQIRGTVE